MRICYTCICILFVQVSVFTQEQAIGCNAHCWEIVLFTVNAEETTFYFSAQSDSTVWDYTKNININYHTATESFTGNINMNSVLLPQELHGWDYANSDVTSCIAGAGRLGYGKYKISVQFNTDEGPANYFFYLDFRDSRYFLESSNYGGYAYSTPDIWIQFDKSIRKFYYSSKPCAIPFTEITNGNTIGIWQIWGASNDVRVSGFQPTSVQNLSVSNYFNRPKLSWTASEPSLGAKYMIYRDNSLIDITAMGATTYVDGNVRINGSPNQTFTYKVRAISGDVSKLSANYSNEVSVDGIEYFEKKGSDSQAKGELSITSKILGVYPNPFNPETKIRFVIEERSSVKITIADMLGRDVAVLLNEDTLKGEHEVVFNGSSLATGTYICTLQVGTQIDTKKIIIQK